MTGWPRRSATRRVLAPRSSSSRSTCQASRSCPEKSPARRTHISSWTRSTSKNGDVHTFEPKPGDVRAVARAKLLVMNGLGLDDWLAKTISNASSSGTPLVKLAVDLPGITLLPGEEPGTQNPHLFMDPKYVELYVDRIASGLQTVDPADANRLAEQ